MASIFMFDDVTVSLLPAAPAGQVYAYAAYSDGYYQNIAQIRSRFPHAEILSIAVRASDIGDCLDVEPGDATNAQAPGWFKRALAAGVTKPCLYTSASNVDALVQEMSNAGIPRSSYRIWSAHYGAGEHLCGPTTCKLTKWSADATQFTDRAEGKSLDESVCEANFFTHVTPPSPNPYPTLTEGDTGTAVDTLQTRLNVWHANPPLKVDGVFGPTTKLDVEDFQRPHGLTVDGVVGPATWGLLVKTPPVSPFAAPAGVKAVVSYVIEWDAVAPVNGVHPTGYKVEITDGGVVFKDGVVPGLSVSVDGLVRNKVYEVSVTPEGGEGTPGVAHFTLTA